VTDPTILPIPDVITVYGADWCGDCHRARRQLDDAGVAYRYVDLGQDAAARALVDRSGIQAIPIVVTPAGEVLVEPSTAELDHAIRAA
jgi:glutaredoxin